jgi:hypothetical protein
VLGQGLDPLNFQFPENRACSAGVILPANHGNG